MSNAKRERQRQQRRDKRASNRAVAEVERMSHAQHRRHLRTAFAGYDAGLLVSLGKFHAKHPQLRVIEGFDGNGEFVRTMPGVGGANNDKFNVRPTIDQKQTPFNVRVGHRLKPFNGIGPPQRITAIVLAGLPQAIGKAIGLTKYGFTYLPPVSVGSGKDIKRVSIGWFALDREIDRQAMRFDTRLNELLRFLP